MKYIVILAALIAPVAWGAPCTIMNSQGESASGLNDPLQQLLAKAVDCPLDVKSFRRELQDTGLNLTPTMVANRGFHNPASGSFSVFESVAGTSGDLTFSDKHFTFGHFTEARGSGLFLAEGGGLIIESIVWDFSKELYNFYELVSSNQGPVWVYRGDSADIVADTANLHVGEPAFGGRLRCSGCHVSGGPIMKELDEPHNAWWTDTTGLPLGGRQPKGELAGIMQDLVDPRHLATLVKEGNEDLWRGEGWAQAQDGFSVQQKLRPLFCSNEVNLTSSAHRLEDSRARGFQIPTTFFVDPWWASTEVVQLSAAQYYEALQAKGSQFPENGLLDADHAWLTPARSYADTMFIQLLVESDTVSSEFVADVLAVNFKNPLFSQVRCDLVRLVPKSDEDWREVFLRELSQSDLAGAAILHAHLTDDDMNEDHHRMKVDQYLRESQSSSGIDTWLGALQERRQAVFSNVISSNPGGQILEPGFRIIFPWWKN